MKILTLSLMTLGLLTLMSCRHSPEQRHKSDSIATDRKQRIERAVAAQDSFNKERGQTSNSGWFCPDNTAMFPPIDIKAWNTVPVVNGRLPTFEETQNGTSLIYYDIKKAPDAKAYNMTLPKLASFFCPATKQRETVIVIQIVQTKKDRVVGYRFLTGGNGTHDLRDFHFLTDSEIKKVTGSTL